MQTGGETYQLTNISSDHTVNVTFGMASFSSSVTSLTLSVNNTGLNSALTGNPRTITIENIGGGTANNLSVTTPDGLPSGTTISSNTCTGDLSAGGTCVITISPGSASSLDASNNPCTTGTQPVSSIVTLSADNGLPVSISINVLGYGCQYQSGLLFLVDDTAPSSRSILGMVVAPVSQSSSISWDANPDCLSNACVPTGATSLNYGQNLGTVPGSANPDNTGTNGPGNTWQISSVLNGNYGNTNNPPATYAAGTCISYNAGSYTDWYLPAPCQVYNSGGSCGTQTWTQTLSFLLNSCTPPAGVTCISGSYWTSVEIPASSLAQYYNTSSATAFNINKSAQLNARCIRDLL